MTDRFKKVHGPEYSAEQLLRDKADQLQAELDRLNAEMFRRSIPTLGQLADALIGLTLRVQGGDEKARATLKEFFRHFEEARSVTSAITVVRNQ